MEQALEIIGRNRISLRKLSLDMAETLAGLANDMNIAMYLRDIFPCPYTYKDAVNYINFVSQNARNYNWAIFEGNNLTGVVTITPQQDIYRHSAEIGYWLGKQYWRKGIASEAVELACNFVFAETNIVRIFASVFDNNAASKKVLLKNGFMMEGIRRKAVLKNKIFLDDHLMAKLKF